MKLPEIFIPEKSLEKKTYELTQGPKIIPHEDLTNNYEPVSHSVHDTIKKAEKIAEKLGTYCGVGYYVFKDKETKLIIKCVFPSPNYNENLKIFLKKNLFKREKILEFFKGTKGTVSTYKPGDWEKSLENLYMLAQQK